MSTYHPSIENLPDDVDTIYHGAIGELVVTVEIGPRFSAGEVDPTRPIAHAVFRHEAGDGGYGITVADPAKLEEAGRILLSAAHALRDRILEATS